MDEFFDNKRIIASVWKWRLHIMVVLAVTIVLSAIISGPFFITPKFKSSARIYPVNITEASQESETEHLLEYLQSKDITFRVIDAFKLDEVYEINKDEKLYQTYLLGEYNENVSYKKTEFETIEIKVLDEDPFRAKEMVDSIIVFLNQEVKAERLKKYADRAKTAKRDFNKKQNEIDSLYDILETLRKETGLVDYMRQSLTATQGLMDAYARGGNPKPAEKVINELIEHGDELNNYQEVIEDYEYALDTLKVRYDDALSYSTQYINYTRVVERPFVADKKAYPIRWLIVFLSTVSAAIVSVVAVSLIDYLREIKANL